MRLSQNRDPVFHSERGGSATCFNPMNHRRKVGDSILRQLVGAIHLTVSDPFQLRTSGGLIRRGAVKGNFGKP